MDRPSLNKYFMDIANLAATRSTCIRRNVGAVLVYDKRILATGYNGAPSGLQHCSDIGECIRNRLNIPSAERQEVCRALHAEQSVIVQTARYGGKGTEGSYLYCTLQPCLICAKMVINAGIERVYYTDGYNDQMTVAFLRSAGIKLFCVNDDGEAIEHIHDDVRSINTALLKKSG